MELQTEFIRSTVEFNEYAYIKANERKETSVPGIYAVGDCTQTYLRQVITAALMGRLQQLPVKDIWVKKIMMIFAIFLKDQSPLWLKN